VSSPRLADRRSHHASTAPIPAIQILRALAALAICLHHALYDASTLRGGGLPLVEVPLEAGVDLFFVLSGFVMALAARPIYAQPGAARMFLARRTARVVPLYWGVTALFVVVGLLLPGTLNTGPPTPAQIVQSLLFIPHVRPDGLVQPVYGLGWTLNYEMGFYALFAAALALPARRAILATLAALLALVLAGLAARPASAPLAFWTAPIILEFVFGLLIGLARLEGVRVAGGMAAALAMMGLALLAFAGEIGASSPLMRPLAWGLPLALVVAGAALGPDGIAPTSPSPGWALAQLGNASYALYLVHPFAVRGVREVWVRLDPGSAGWPYIAAALIAAILAALLVHRGFERPVTAWAVRRLGARPRGRD